MIKAWKNLNQACIVPEPGLGLWIELDQIQGLTDQSLKYTIQD